MNMPTPPDSPPAVARTITVVLDLDAPAFPLSASAAGSDDGPPISLREAIVEAAARLFVDDAKRDGGMSDRFRALTEVVRRVRDEEIREQVRPLIAEAIAAPVVQTNRFGDPVGEPTTLRELIVKEATDQLKTSTAVRSAVGGSRRDTTLLEATIAQEVGAALTKELQEALQSAKSELLETVQARAAEVLTESLKRALPRV